MRLVLLSLLFAIMAPCSAQELLTPKILTEYETAWESGCVECIERLFTKRGWKKCSVKRDGVKVKCSDEHVRIITHSTSRDLHWLGQPHVTPRKWWGRHVVVSAYRGWIVYDGELIELHGVIGFEMNGKDRIRKIRPEVATPFPEEYASYWPIVQREARRQRYATIGDIGTTVCAILRFGSGVEANFIVRPIFQGFGPIPGGIFLFLGTDSYYQWVLEDIYWDGLAQSDGAIGPWQEGAILGLRWLVVVNNATVCFA